MSRQERLDRQRIQRALQRAAGQDVLLGDECAARSCSRSRADCRSRSRSTRSITPLKAMVAPSSPVRVDAPVGAARQAEAQLLQEGPETTRLLRLTFPRHVCPQFLAQLVLLVLPQWTGAEAVPFQQPGAAPHHRPAPGRPGSRSADPGPARCSSAPSRANSFSRISCTRLPRCIDIQPLSGVGQRFELEPVLRPEGVGADAVSVEARDAPTSSRTVAPAQVREHLVCRPRRLRGGRAVPSHHAARRPVRAAQHGLPRTGQLAGHGRCAAESQGFEQLAVGGGPGRDRAAPRVAARSTRSANPSTRSITSVQYAEGSHSAPLAS